MVTGVNGRLTGGVAQNLKDIEENQGVHMTLSVEQTNTKSSKLAIIGWLAGLAYYVWFGSIEASILGHAILIVGGIFVSSIVIGGGVAFFFGLLTRIFTGSWDGSPHGYAWGAFIAPVIAFFCVQPVASALQGLV